MDMQATDNSSGSLHLGSFFPGTQSIGRMMLQPFLPGYWLNAGLERQLVPGTSHGGGPSHTTFSEEDVGVCFSREFLLLLLGCCCVWLFGTPGTGAYQAPLSSTVSQSALKFMSIESVMLLNISSSVIPFSSCLQSFPASGYFLMSQPFTSGGQSTGGSASASVL